MRSSPLYRKHSSYRFTLLEMLIVMALIAMTAGLIGFKVADLLEQQRFRTGVDQIVDKLATAQNLMLIFQTDVTVQFEEGAKGEQLCHVDCDYPLSPVLVKLLNQDQVLKGIKRVSFKSKDSTGDVSCLKFSSLRSQLPEGTLLLSGYSDLHQEGPMYRELVLSGQMSPIALKPKPDTAFKKPESAVVYPSDLRAEWKLNQEEPTNAKASSS